MRKSIALMALAGLAAVAGVPMAAPVSVSTAAMVSGQRMSPPDSILFRNGQVVEGTILSETDTHVKIRVKVAGIEAETEYAKSEILKIQRGVKTDAPKPEATPAPDAKVKAASTPASASGKKSVYVVELEGIFGEDITQTPIRQAIADAKQHQPDYLVVVLNNDWTTDGGLSKLPEEAGQFDLLFRAEDLDPIFTREIPTEWDKQPELVFWVKTAMGGAAFLPLISPNIYFHSEGRMGGIGGVDFLFGSTGDEVVRQKQYSLRMGHAEGMAITGGYPPELVRAMAWVQYELSVSFEGDTPVYHERLPEPGETLLTDNPFKDPDTLEQRVTGEGNDVLTLKAEMARKLKVSKGTVDTMEDLLFQLGIQRNYELIDGRSDEIMKSWRDQMATYGKTIRRMWAEFREIQVEPPGEYRERTQARSRQMKKLDEIIRFIEKYEECRDPRAEGVPDKTSLEIIREQIKLEQLKDKK